MRYRLRTLLIVMAAAPIWICLITIVSTTIRLQRLDRRALVVAPILLAGITAALYRLKRTTPDGLALAVLLDSVEADSHRQCRKHLFPLAMFRFTIRDVLWLMIVVGLTCLTISFARQHSALRTRVKVLSAQAAAQGQEIHDLKERELALIRAVEQKYGGRIGEWKLWPDPDRPSQWRAELESER